MCVHALCTYATSIEYMMSIIYVLLDADCTYMHVRNIHTTHMMLLVVVVMLIFISRVYAAPRVYIT